MPSNAESVAITNAYRARLIAIRRTIVTATASAWGGVIDLTDLDRTFGVWLSGAVAMTSRAQAAAAGTSGAYLGFFIASELGIDAPASDIDPSTYAGTTSYGRPLEQLLAPTVATVKAALAADRPPDVALQLGQGRAVRNIGFQTDEAGRTALDDAMGASDHVRGWRRVTSGRPCGACLAAATGAIQETEEVLEVHPHCSCTKEPVIDGATDHVQRPTGEEMFDAMSKTEQDDLFDGRGGADKAELLRSGAVSLPDLITHTDQVSGQTVITETPLVGLRRG